MPNQICLLFRIAFAITLIVPSPIIAQEITFQHPSRGFTSWHPAETWEQSLLTGNGTMGALVTGQPYEETIILSHSALYLPQQRSGKSFEQQNRLGEIKQLLLKGKYQEASNFSAAMRKEQGFDDIRDPFIPAFDLKIQQKAGHIEKYERSVNFETGEAIVNWKDETGTFQRKIFVSRADSLIVLSIKGNKLINCVLRFAQRPIAWDQWKFVNEGVKAMHADAEKGSLNFTSEFKYQYPGGLTGYAGVGSITQTGGTNYFEDGRLVIKDAKEVLLLVKIKPSYAAVKNMSKQLKEEVSALREFGYDKLLQRHVQIHGALFSKVKLDLKASAEERMLSSESLIQRGDDKVSPALLERVFDAGRYNILSATGVLAPNLQGLWSGTWTAPWSSGFTTDGNLPTALSILMPGNMPELMKGFFDYHESMLEEYRKGAKSLFGTRGIHVPAQLTTRGIETDFGETWCLNYWSGAAGWTASFFNDYYLYTGDQKFLKDRGYPFMKEAALFYEDFLKTGDNGKLIFIPSYSPENNPKGINSQATINATMDIMIARQLLTNCIAAAKVLQLDREKVKVWQGMLSKMPDYEINNEGMLKEWAWPGLEDNYSHRHVSQLYALYDGVSAEFRNNPALAKAAEGVLEKKMDFRLKEGGGEMAFGLVHLGLVAAHLGDAKKAGEVTNLLASTYWSKGMASYHNVKGMFNMDISGGLPYLMIQMLCYAEAGTVYVLPALPESWREGTIEGILLKGQIVVNRLNWNNKNVTIELISPINQNVNMIYGTTTTKLKLKAGEKQQISLIR